MERERWLTIQRLYHYARERQRGERAQLLVEACGGDEQLRREVESLLAQEDGPGSFLGKPALEVLAEALARNQAETPGTATTGTRLGQVVSHYRILAKLGAGGIGEVWKARDTQLNRVVALKFISTERPGSAPIRELLREARAASALNHPNIVTIFEVSEFENSAFLAMEFVEGETLRARLKRPPVPVEEATAIAQQIVTGLAAAHRSGIVHRDLKPENIMLRVDGFVKLMDFGLAKAVPRGEAVVEELAPPSAPTDGNAIVGTLTYMSPEQARGRPVNVTSDIFSFGIIFYELLTGEHPFRAETAMDTLSAILGKNPVSVSVKSATVPTTLSAIVARALEKEPSRRYATGMDLLVDLKKVIPAQPALVRVAPSDFQVRHNPRWMRALGVVLIAAILSVAAWRLRSSPKDGGLVAPVRSVAVMNFRAALDDHGASALAQDLPDELDAALSKTGLQIASHESVLDLGNAPKPREVGAQLGVEAVLDGSVRSTGSKLRVHVELANTQTGFMIWSETFTFEGPDTLSGEQRTAALIAQEVRRVLAAQK